jgi:hypothetical protein
MELKLCSRFQFYGKIDLDLWPCSPKINRGCSTQYGQSFYDFWTLWTKWNLSYVPETVVSFKEIVTLTLWPKINRVFYPIWTIILWSLNTVGQMELQLCSGNCFQFKGNSNLDLVTPKSIGVFYPIWTIILWSLNTVGQLN